MPTSMASFDPSSSSLQGTPSKIQVEGEKEVHGNADPSTPMATPTPESSSAGATEPSQNQVEGEKEVHGNADPSTPIATPTPESSSVGATDPSQNQVEAKKSTEKKNRQKWPKIVLHGKYERTPKKTKTPKPTPKTPKPLKPKRNPSVGKQKNTKRSDSDIGALVVVEDVVVQTEDLPVEVVAPKEKQLLIYYRRKYKFKANTPLLLDQGTTLLRLKEAPKRVLDFDLNCQLEPPQVAETAQVEVKDSIRKGCRASLGLRCQCCLCLIEKIKPTFPKECKKKRTMGTNKFSKKMVVFPKECRKKRKMRMNKFAKKAVKDQQNPSNEGIEAPRNESIDSRYEVNLPINGLDHSKIEDHKTSNKIVKKQNKEAKVLKERKPPKNGSASKRKKEDKEEHNIWVNATWDERVDIISKKFENLSLYDDLIKLHATTKMEVKFENETLELVKLLNDSAWDGSDPVKDEEESKKKWWEEQRNELLQKVGVFSLVTSQLLGDRTFSPWKGSVVDSVVGVYLTQNVSDSLSSSAYMSLAARFPVKEPKRNIQLSIEYNSASTHEEPDMDLNLNKVPLSNQEIKKNSKDKDNVKVDWDALRTTYSQKSYGKPRNPDTTDSVDWDAVRKANVEEIAKIIEKRGQHNIMAKKIKDFLNRLVVDHGSIDLEWLRVVPPEKVTEFLLDIYGIGLKSVECLRLLTLHHHAFPVDVNVCRIAVRLGWVPLETLPDLVQFHLLSNYPYLDQVQRYLWARLHILDQKSLYRLHYGMITFGKIFCTARNPNCQACPLRGQCKYYASKSASSRLALPGSQQSGSKKASSKIRNPFVDLNRSSLVLSNPLIGLSHTEKKCEPIIEEPPSPEPERLPFLEKDIEDFFIDDPDEMSFIDLTSQRFVVDDRSKAMIALSSQSSSSVPPVQKLIAKLRTIHQVYELPDDHCLLKEIAKREPEDPCYYLLSIWPQDETCLEQDNQSVLGTLLIPSRTAMQGRFPLNGTYFQINEVFVDYETCMCPIKVPRELIWDLPKRKLYCGTSVGTMLKGIELDQIMECFQSGYVCIRAFNRSTRYPEELPSKFHERNTTTPSPSKKSDHIKKPDPTPRKQRKTTPNKTT